MKSILDESILKELDHFNFRGNEISMVMSKLYNNKIKNSFLSFLIENRGKVMTIPIVFKEISRLNA